MMYTVDSTTATSATLSNLQCNTQYTISVYAGGGSIGKRSLPRVVSLPARGTCTSILLDTYILIVYTSLCIDIPPAPPSPTEVTVRIITATSIEVAWQWTTSGPAPRCFNTTHVNYRHPEGNGESSLQLRDPAATEAIFPDLQPSTRYNITVVATAGEHRRESTAIAVLLPLVLQGMTNVLSLYY